MQPEGDDLNPYAAPQSDVAPASEAAATMKRPASSNWVVLFCLLISIWCLYIQISLLAELGLSQWCSRFLVWPPTALLMTLTTTSFVISSLIRRLGLLAYILGVALTLIFCCFIVKISIDLFQQPPFADPTSEPAEKIGGVVGIALVMSPIFYLFYRFTFGLPSRRFYRVTQQ